MNPFHIWLVCFFIWWCYNGGPTLVRIRDDHPMIGGYIVEVSPSGTLWWYEIETVHYWAEAVAIVESHIKEKGGTFVRS